MNSNRNFVSLAILVMFIAGVLGVSKSADTPGFAVKEAPAYLLAGKGNG